MIYVSFSKNCSVFPTSSMTQLFVFLLSLIYNSNRKNYAGELLKVVKNMFVFVFNGYCYKIFEIQYYKRLIGHTAPR